MKTKTNNMIKRSDRKNETKKTNSTENVDRFRVMFDAVLTYFGKAEFI